MHELSVCGAIGEIVTRRADGRPVTTIRVRVGQLRQIVPDTLAYCWGMVSSGTTLDGSRLEVETVAATLLCGDCGVLSTVGPVPLMACGGCGGFAVTVRTGEEFVLVSIDCAKESGDE